MVVWCRRVSAKEEGSRIGASRREPAVDTRFLHSAFTVGAMVETLVDEELRRAGVPTRLFSLLAWVWRLQPVPPTRLSAETRVPPTTLRDNVHALVQRGDVRRVPNPEDGRSYLLEVTDQGRDLVARGSPALERALARIEGHLAGDVDAYALKLEELRDALSKALASEEATSPIGSG